MEDIRGPERSETGGWGLGGIPARNTRLNLHVTSYTKAYRSRLSQLGAIASSCVLTGHAGRICRLSAAHG
jgi:hypothetical protein